MKRYDLDKIEEVISKKIDKNRMAHSIAVKDTAACLAMKYGYEAGMRGEEHKDFIHMAMVAGILHDNAKCVSDKDMLDACEEACFCDVWENQIAGSAQFNHCIYIFLVKTRIQHTIVAHCRVNNAQAAFSTHVLQNILYIDNVSGGTQVTGVHGIEGDSLFMPVSENLRNVFRQVCEGEPIESCMSGQYCSWNNCCFMTACR